MRLAAWGSPFCRFWGPFGSHRFELILRSNDRIQGVPAADLDNRFVALEVPVQELASLEPVDAGFEVGCRGRAAFGKGQAGAPEALQEGGFIRRFTDHRTELHDRLIYGGQALEDGNQLFPDLASLVHWVPLHAKDSLEIRLIEITLPAAGKRCNL